MNDTSNPRRTFSTPAEQAAYEAALDDIRRDMDELAKQVRSGTPQGLCETLSRYAYSDRLGNNNLRPVWATVIQLIRLVQDRAPLGLTTVSGKLMPVTEAPARVDAQALADDHAVAEGLAFDAGNDAARKGIHELFISDVGPEIDGLTGERPFCRFQFYEDRGDPSVGMPGTAYWVLADDQKGTELADLLERAKATA